MNIVYFEKGYEDGTEPEDVFQTVGVDTETMKVVDEGGLRFKAHVPVISDCLSKEDLIFKMELSEWFLAE